MTYWDCCITFAVDDLDDVVTRLLLAYGAELSCEVVQYAYMVRLGYIRGPKGICWGSPSSSGRAVPAWA